MSIQQEQRFHVVIPILDTTPISGNEKPPGLGTVPKGEESQNKTGAPRSHAFATSLSTPRHHPPPLLLFFLVFFLMYVMMDGKITSKSWDLASKTLGCCGVGFHPVRGH